MQYISLYYNVIMISHCTIYRMLSSKKSGLKTMEGLSLKGTLSKE